MELGEVQSVDRYIKALVKAYPKPVNQTELAELAGVSKSAVSQVRNILIELCESKSLIREKKLVLKSDAESIGMLLAYGLFAFEEDFLKEYIMSDYFAQIFDEEKLFNKIKDEFNEYNIGTYFSMDDLSWLFKLMQLKIRNYEMIESEDDDLDLFYDAFPTMFPGNYYFLFKAIPDDDLSFLHEKEYIILLELRDKIYHFVINNLDKISTKLIPLLGQLDIDEKNEYDIMSKALKYYIKYAFIKILKIFTENIYSETLERGIELNISLREIGSTFARVGREE